MYLKYIILNSGEASCVSYWYVVCYLKGNAVISKSREVFQVDFFLGGGGNLFKILEEYTPLRESVRERERER